MNKILALILVLLLTFSTMVGCKTKKTNVDELRYDPTTVNTSMTGRVEVWWGPMDYMKQPLEDAIVAFNKKFPNVEIIGYTIDSLIDERTIDEKSAKEMFDFIDSKGIFVEVCLCGNEEKISELRRQRNVL